MNVSTSHVYTRPQVAAGSPWGAMRPCDGEGSPLLEDAYLSASRSSGSAPPPVRTSPLLSPNLLEAAAVGAGAPGATMVPLQILIMGGPGSGKGTQGKLLAERYGIPHVSTGDLCRAEAEQPTERGRQVKETLAAGKMVSSDIVYALLSERLKQDDCEPGFILDGFPRTFDQVPMLKALMRDVGAGDFVVLGLELTDGVMKQRMLDRGREGETEEVIDGRIRDYHGLTEPVIEYFKSQGEYFGVDSNQAIPEVQQDLQLVVDTPAHLRPR